MSSVFDLEKHTLVLELTSDPDLVNWIEQMARIENRSREEFLAKWLLEAHRRGLLTPFHKQ